MSRLIRVPGSKHYRADTSGLAEIGRSSTLQAEALAAAQRIAAAANAAGEGDYAAAPAGVRAGWQNEYRAGAVVREVTPVARDRKGRVLLTAVQTVAATTPR